MVLTIVGRKKARPWTVTLFRRNTNAVERVTGLMIPLINFLVSILSKTSVAPSLSDLTRAIARSFSFSVSQRAVSGRSVRVTIGVGEDILAREY